MSYRQWFQMGEDEFTLILECTDEIADNMARIGALGGKKVVKVNLPPIGWLEQELTRAVTAKLKAEEYFNIVARGLTCR